MHLRPNLGIDGDRLWSSLMEMAKIGGTPKGGCNRQALTPEDGEARALFRRWCEAAGTTVRIDPLGSMFARREGLEDLPPVLIGSHLDTQPTGGKFDGVLGVMAGLEILRRMEEAGIRTRRPIEVVNWTNEEGCRFAPAMLASAAYAGVLPVEKALDTRDIAGIRFGDALESIGIVPDRPLGGDKIAAYLELHIEQGPILEAEGKEVGLVTSGQGLFWYDAVITGFESHSGSTPMHMRDDALVAAAQLIEALRKIGTEANPPGTATVGQFEVFPNSRNVIPGEVRMTIDMRHPDPAVLRAMDQRFHETVAALQKGRIRIELTQVAATQPLSFDPGMLAMLREEADAMGISHRNIISGAGHDAFHMAKIAPAALIFTPCAGGVSHNEAESIEPHQAEAGANLLMRAALRLADMP
ncbi:MAG: Zn-dependent hydrolase [Beijerinckiaceae bacterium]|nr:Zn-dependent hydrolase [Beijerinckiaceae bacterium]